LLEASVPPLTQQKARAVSPGLFVIKYRKRFRRPACKASRRKP
jgi:hypothetical protein